MTPDPDPPPLDHRHFLPDASASEWATVLEYCERRPLHPDQSLYTPGDHYRLLEDRCLAFLVSGSVHLRVFGRDEPVRLLSPAVLGRGVFFTGELLFYRGVTVAEECECLVLSTAAFHRLAEAHPQLAIALAMEMGSEMALTVMSQFDRGTRQGRAVWEDPQAQPS